MSDVNPPAIDPALMSRVKSILLQPKMEWERIDAEMATVKSVFIPYALLLAAIGPIASLIGGQMMPVMGLKMPMFAALAGAIASYVIALISVYLLSLIINMLAPTFGGVSDPIKATQVAVYAMTASWLSGIFSIIPLLGILGLVGLYSLYLLYVGLPKLMKAPPEKAVIYTVVVVIMTVVLALISSFLVGALTLIFGGGAVLGSAVMSGM